MRTDAVLWPRARRCREAVVTFYNHRRRVLKETADAAASAGGSGGADEDDTPFLFGKRPSMADITLAVRAPCTVLVFTPLPTVSIHGGVPPSANALEVRRVMGACVCCVCVSVCNVFMCSRVRTVAVALQVFLRVLRTGNVLSGFPPKIQAYVARCTREFSLDKLEDGTANGFGSGLQDVVTKRTAELGDIEVPPYTPPRVFTPSGGGANAALAGGDDDGLPSPSSQGVATPAPSSAGAENESGAAPVAVHTDTRASLGAE